MTGFDVAVLMILVISALIGLWRGVISEVLSLAGWVAAFLVAREFAAEASPWMKSLVAQPEWRVAAAFIVLFIATLLGVMLLRWAVSSLVRAVGLGWIDRLLGAAFGAVRGVAIAFALVLVAGLTALPAEAMWREAVLSPPLETAVIASKPWLPDGLAKRIHYRNR